MGLKRVSWVRRYQGQCRALRPLGHQGYRLRNHKKDQPLCSGYTPPLPAGCSVLFCALLCFVSCGAAVCGAFCVVPAGVWGACVGLGSCAVLLGAVLCWAVLCCFCPALLSCAAAFSAGSGLRAGSGLFLFLCSACAVLCWCACVVALCAVLSCPCGAGWCFVLLPVVFVCLLPQTISELRSFMGCVNFFSGYVRMYADLSGALHKMLQVGRFDGCKGSKKKFTWTTEAEEAFHKLKERLLGQLGLFLVDRDKGFVLCTDASDYAVKAVLEQVRCDGTHVPVASWSRVLAEGQCRTWTARERETFAIVCALRKWSGHIGLQPVVVCTDHQSLHIWQKEHVYTPSGPAAGLAQWHETFPKFDLSVVYVPRKDNTVADCLSCWAYPAGKAWMDISSHGDAEETEEAKRIIELEKAMGEGDTKCFVIMASKAELSQRQDARVLVLMEETLDECLMAPIEYVESVLMEDWSEDYGASEH